MASTSFSRIASIPALATQVLLATCLSASTAVAAADINPGQYPALDKKAVGQLRHIVRLSRQLPGDWSDMGTDLWYSAERTLTFQLSYMATAVGLAQYEYTPAYRELHRDTMDRLIQKMTLPDVWETWLNSSRAGTVRNKTPDLQRGWIDPVRKHNIMLKGYLVQAAAMYDMLYRDGKYDRADAFTFRYMTGTWGNGPVTFRYSLPDIVRIIHQEYIDGGYQGVQCEPNLIFVQCNQPPILGLINYDQIHGTRYAVDVMPKFKDAWIKRGYVDRSSSQAVNFIVASTGEQDRKSGIITDAWNGSWMHAWDPDYVRGLYGNLKAPYSRRLLSGDYARNVPPYGDKDMIPLGFGLFSFWAAEMGDREVSNQLLAYAERNFNPVWKDGTYYYPRSMDHTVDSQGNTHGVDAWTGNALLALTRLNRGGGFRDLYSNPWGVEQIASPEIVNVDYASTSVNQARWDPARKALIVTLSAGPVRAARFEFDVLRLDRTKDYRVFRNGKLLGRLDKKGTSAGGAIRWHGDVLKIATPMSDRTSFVIVQA
jgi:hypothetical protein